MPIAQGLIVLWNTYSVCKIHYIYMYMYIWIRALRIYMLRYLVERRDLVNRGSNEQSDICVAGVGLSSIRPL